jgi:hypothetical protein
MTQVRPQGSKRNLCLSVVLASLGLTTTGDVAAADTFDGVYRGTQRVTLTNNHGLCIAQNQDNIVLQIQNNHFTKAWANASLSVDVAADGSFVAHEFGAHNPGPVVPNDIKGTITGGDLEADIGDAGCAGHLSLKKS